MKKLLLLKFPNEDKESISWKDEVKLSEKFFETLVEIKQPVVLEAAVPQVGEEIHFYLAAEANVSDLISHQIQKIWPGVQISSADDYDIFNLRGFNEGVYLKGTPESSFLTYQQVETDNFSLVLAVLARLEEIGEGAALQVVIQPLAKTFWQRFFSGKNSQALFKINLRIIVSAASQFRVKEIFGDLNNIFLLKTAKPKNLKKFHFGFCFRDFDNEQKIILNSEALATIFHFPISALLVPRIKWLKSKEVPAPAHLSNQGVVIGENIFRGKVQPIFLDYLDRHHHLEIIGQAGTGKSTLLINLALQDIKQGKGVAILDPEGDIVEAVAGALPASRSQDVIYLDPTDLWHPLALNLLEFNSPHPEEKTFIIDEAQAILQKIFVKEISHPLLDKYLRNCLKLLLAEHQEPATLIDIPRIFTDANFRQQKLQRLVDESLINFWKNEITLHEVVPFITARFNNLLANDYLRPIIGQVNSSFNFRKALDGGKIILVNLAKQRLGELNSQLLGMILMAKISLAALSRLDQSREKRRPFYLFLDEFYNYFTDSLAISLGSASKYGLYFNVAHRTTNELSPILLNFVSNFGSIIVFRVGLSEAEVLVDKLAPTFSVNDLMNLDNFHAVSRILIKENLSSPFNLRISPPPLFNLNQLKEIKDLSRAIYNRGRQKVEMEIYERFSTR